MINNRKVKDKKKERRGVKGRSGSVLRGWKVCAEPILQVPHKAKGGAWGRQ